MNALLSVLHVLRSGCAWRLLPADWPPGQNVYYYWRKWRRDGTLERIHAVLRDGLRIASGRDPQPSAGSMDSQSVKTTGVGGARGYDGAKKLVGRRRVVERTFAWLLFNRRLSRDYERRCTNERDLDLSRHDPLDAA